MNALEFRHTLTPKLIIHHRNVECIDDIELSYTDWHGEKVVWGHRRTMKCSDCGQVWQESITSPMVIEDEVANNLKEYYPQFNIVSCKEEKKW